jgi:hypothetical protein
MPNWCRNSMTVTGSVEEVARFKQMCNAGELFRSGIPADDFHDFRVYGDEPGRYEFDFDTAWVSPVNAWNQLGAMFPALDFSVKGREPLADFALRGTIKDGGLFEYELMDQPGIWEAVDSKTGKTFSGTLKEIMRAAGDELPIWGAAPAWDDPRVRCCGRRPRGTNDGEFTVT